METINSVRQTVNPSLHIEGILRTLYDPRNALTNEVSEQLHQHFEGLVYRTVIPRNVRLAEAPSHGVPGIVYDRLSRGSTAYMALAGEFMRRQEQNQREPANGAKAKAESRPGGPPGVRPVEYCQADEVKPQAEAPPQALNNCRSSGFSKAFFSRAGNLIRTPCKHLQTALRHRAFCNLLLSGLSPQTGSKSCLASVVGERLSWRAWIASRLS